MSVTIKLTRPFKAFNKEVSELTLEEPSGKLFAKLGEPVIVCENRSGSAYGVEQVEVINAYIVELIRPAEVGVVAMQELSMTDMKQLKKALFSFFVAAEQTISASSSASLSSVSGS